MRRIALLALTSAFLATWTGVAVALDADDLSELLGYTMVAASNVDDEFEGAEPDKVVRLDNGMVFQFDEYNYAYAYRPSVAVFAEHVTAARMLEAGIPKPPAGGITVYKLVIDDEIYDAHRLR